jgi:hypothetical protein
MPESTAVFNSPACDRFFIIVKIKLWSSGQDLSVVLYIVTVGVDENAASIIRVKGFI